MVVVSSRLVIGCSQLQLNQIEATASQNVRNLSYVIRTAELQLPVVRQGAAGRRIQWQAAQYHNVLEILRYPICAGLSGVWR